jgi:putative transposase
MTETSQGSIDVAQKWDHSDKRRTVGRPATPQEVVDLILQFARENPTSGYDRIADALANIGHRVSDQTVGNILMGHGIEPAPERKRTTTWSAFLKAHWNQLAAIDFTTIEVWTKSGLVTYYLLFAMRLATRRVLFPRLHASGDLARKRRVVWRRLGFCRRVDTVAIPFTRSRSEN